MTLLFLLLACSPDPDTAAPADTAIEDSALEDTGLPDLLAPDQPGPWAVGSWDETITGPDGVDLTVQVWYPAFEAGPELYPYLYGYTAQATTSAPAACETPRPVLVFSHGNAGMRYHTLYLAERMASRGWVVVAPDHTFGAAGRWTSPPASTGWWSAPSPRGAPSRAASIRARATRWRVTPSAA